MCFAVGSLVLCLEKPGFLAPNAASPIVSTRQVLLVICVMIQGPSNGKTDRYRNGERGGQLYRMSCQVLSLEREQLRHHRGEAVDAVKGESFMSAVKRFKEPKESQSTYGSNL